MAEPRQVIQSAPAVVQRVLMTADGIGGVWTYALDLARELTAARVEVTLATMGAPLAPTQRAEAARLDRLHLVESHYRIEWMDRPWEDVAAAGAWLRGLAQQVRPDVIHFNGYAHAARAWPAPVLVVAHSCVYSWFAAVRGRAPPEDWQRYRQAVSAGLRGADLVTAPTAAMLRSLQQHYGEFAAAGPVYNGRDPALYRSGPKAPLVLTAGRIWDEAKNIAALDTVAPWLHWPVFAAGPSHSPDGAPLRTRNLRLLGNLAPAELARWFARAAIFALPARYEPFGLAALEAALSGGALILGDIPTLREVWGDAALFVPPDNHRALADAINDLIAEPARRDEYAARAQRRARRFTADRMAAAYLALYAQLLAHRGPSGRPGGAQHDATGAAAAERR